jgi:dimethylhistidine N-methyltransferase
MSDIERFLMRKTASLASFDDIHVKNNDFLAESLDGLGQAQKTLSCKYFYDEHGSDLFQKICDLPEYYLTRIETQLLRDISGEISDAIGRGCEMIEYGTGSSEKMRIVLDALKDPAAFIAVDISREHLLQVTEALAADRTDLTVHAVCADFTQPLDLPASTGGGNHVAFFPGSSLGNFADGEAVEFLKGIAETVGVGGGLLIGLDLKKDAAVLEAAYDDAQGVTAAFNINLLVRLNNECGANFDLDGFRHKAVYNADIGRVEMHLVSLRAQSVTLGGQTFDFAKHETIHTENSHKYDIDEFQELAGQAGFTPVKVWTDRDDLFSIHYLTV